MTFCVVWPRAPSLQLLMEADVERADQGAGRHERAADRAELARNGYRDRTLDTRLGSLNLKIPKLRAGTLLPAVPGGARKTTAGRKGVGRRHPGGLDRRGVDAPGRRDRAGDGACRMEFVGRRDARFCLAACRQRGRRRAGRSKTGPPR